MKARRRIVLVLSTLLLTLGASTTELAEKLDPVDPADSAWQQLATRLSALPDGRAEFEEERLFRFRSKPVHLAGIARASAQHGLSLEYLTPEPRIVIVDAQGVIFRESGRDRAGPADARAQLMNQAMLRLNRFDLGALARDFVLQGQLGGTGWLLHLQPRSAESAQIDLELQADGDATGVRRIELFQRGRRIVTIRIQPPHAVPDGFAPEEIRRFFRGMP